MISNVLGSNVAEDLQKQVKKNKVDGWDGIFMIIKSYGFLTNIFNF